MPDKPFDLPTLVQRSRAARAEIAANPGLPDATKLLFEVQYAQHELTATLLHSGTDFKTAMQIAYNVLPE